MRVGSVMVVAAAVMLSGACYGQAQPGGTPTPGSKPSAKPRPTRPAPPPYVPQQKMPGESATAPRGVFMPENQDARAAIDDAVARAAALQQRVVVVWGGNGEKRAEALKTVMTLPDVRRISGREYQTVLANIHDGVYSKDNRAVAEAFGVKFEEGAAADHAVLMVLDAEAGGVPVAQMNLLATVDKTRPSRYLPDRVEAFLFANRRPMPSAEEVLNTALARARSEVRHVFLRFYEPPSEWGERFERWMGRPEIAGIFNKHMVVAVVDITRNGLGGDLFAKYAPHPLGYPWYLVVSDNGTGLAFSQPPTEGAKNIGFPTDDAEIAAFIALVRIGAPALTDAEAKVLRDSLVGEREARKAEAKPENKPESRPENKGS